MSRVAIVGEGVIGISTALAIQQRIPAAKITIISDRPFEETCSFGPAGLFRIDNVNWQKNREYGRLTFEWLEKLCRQVPGSQSGVKLLSGYIQSDDRESLQTQELANAGIVYNFRWLSTREIHQQFENPSKYCIFFSAYASEGNKYVPYLKSLLRNVVFEQRCLKSLDEVSGEFDVVVNCAGLNAGKLSGDDETVEPIRGFVLQANAPWHKHFLYRDFDTFTIPKENVVAIGSVKQRGAWKTTVDDDEVEDVLERYCRLHPAMKGVKVEGVWCNLRPFRPDGIRIERQTRHTSSGKSYQVVHHYGHGGSGFTLGWGSALTAAMVVEEALTKAKL